MTEITSQSINHGIYDSVKDWMMVLLSGAFVVLYGLALMGRLKPLADISMVSRLEPIIFVFIGYFFGQHNERTLKGEVSRQTNKADAAQLSKEQMLRSREALEEKLKSARAALGATSSDLDLGNGDASLRDVEVRHYMAAARRVLDA